MPNFCSRRVAKDQSDEYVGSPCQQGAHAVVNVFLDFNSGQPALVPCGFLCEIPVVLGIRKPSCHENGGSAQSADKDGNSGPKKNANTR